MSKLKKIVGSFPKANPVGAAMDAKKHGGKPFKAFLDPGSHIFNSGPRSAAQADKAYAKSPEGMKEKKRADSYAAAGMTPPEGMKKGGKVKNCRGGGAATRGTRYGGKY